MSKTQKSKPAAAPAKQLPPTKNKQVIDLLLREGRHNSAVHNARRQKSLERCDFADCVARPTGVEPVASRLEVSRSIQLS